MTAAAAPTLSPQRKNKMSDDAKAETEWCCDGKDCSKIIQEKDGQVTNDDEALFLCHACFKSHEQENEDFGKCEDCSVKLNEGDHPNTKCQDCIEQEAEAEAEANATRKQCSVCSERSSCGNYNEDKKWICEGCEEEKKAEAIALLTYSAFVEMFEPSQDFSGYEDDEGIEILWKTVPCKNPTREAGGWCAFLWKPASEVYTGKWIRQEYNSSSPFAMWWSDMTD